MNVGDCYIQIDEDYIAIFRITSLGISCIEASDISLDKDSLLYTYNSEDYSIELMTTKIPISPQLFEDLLTLLQEYLALIKEVVKINTLPSKFQLQEGRTFADDFTIYTLQKKNSNDTWSIVGRRFDENGIEKFYCNDDFVKRYILEKCRLVADGTDIKVENLCSTLHDKAREMIRKWFNRRCWDTEILPTLAQRLTLEELKIVEKECAMVKNWQSGD